MNIVFNLFLFCNQEIINHRGATIFFTILITESTVETLKRIFEHNFK